MTVKANFKASPLFVLLLRCLVQLSVRVNCNAIYSELIACDLLVCTNKMSTALAVVLILFIRRVGFEIGRKLTKTITLHILTSCSYFTTCFLLYLYNITYRLCLVFGNHLYLQTALDMLQ